MRACPYCNRFSVDVIGFCPNCDREVLNKMPASPRSMLPGGPYKNDAPWDKVNKLTEQPKENPLTRQEGGSHYKATKIQPIEVIWDWGLGFELGSALKYIQRHKRKGGAEDIKKAIHYLELYLEKHK